MLRFVKPWLPLILLVAAANGLISVAGVGIAAVNKQVVDAATASRPEFDAKMFALLAAATFLNIIFSNVLGVGKTLFNERYSYSLKEQFYGKLMRVKWLQLSRLHSGDIMTRLTGDIDVVAAGMFSVIPSLAYIVFQLAAAFGVLYYYDHTLAWIALCLGPFGLALSAVLGKIFAKYQRQSRENESAYRAFLQESVENLVIAKSFSREEANCRRMREFWNIRYGIIKKRSVAGLGIGVAMNVVFSGGYLLAFGWSLMRMVQGEITYGTVTLLMKPLRD